MKTIKIALVGRPNVGKSSLFNRIVRRRIAIVDEMEGVTRDRLYAETEAFGCRLEVIDTGGIDASSTILFAEEVRRQAEIAVEEAAGLIMVVDGQVGLTHLDESVAHLLLRSGKPLIVAVNKVDDDRNVSLVTPFYALGIKTVLPVSAIHGTNVAELLELVISQCPEKEKKVIDGGIRVAIIGKPNVGKSTLINTLLKEERCVVSPIAGTTRDAVTVSILYENDPFIFVDTAGMRKKKSEHEVVDKFSSIRCERAIEHADICVLMVDSREGITTREKRFASMVEKKGKGCLIFFNKWDLVKGFRMEHCEKSLVDKAAFLHYCPKIFGSALSGHNVLKIFPYIKEIHAYLHKRISTGQLNRFVERVVRKVAPPLLKGKRLHIYYMAQVDHSPPRFVCFVNNLNFVSEAYKKYLFNQFRMEYRFIGVPLVFYLKGKHRKKRETKSADAPTFLQEPLLFDEGGGGSHL